MGQRLQAPRAHESWVTSSASVSTPHCILKGRSTRRKRDIGTTSCLHDRYSTQETDVSQGIPQLEPTIEEASTRCRRCPSREPTCPYKPITTHAPSTYTVPKRTSHQLLTTTQHHRDKVTDKHARACPEWHDDTQKGTPKRGTTRTWARVGNHSLLKLACSPPE